VKSELKIIKQQHPELGHKAAFEKVCRSWQVSKPDLAQAAAEEKGGKQEMTPTRSKLGTRYISCVLAAWVSLIFFTVTLHSLTLTQHVQSGGWHHALIPLLSYAILSGSGK
jgi:ferric-dicitrate binding protein FerR (iron transport regulator)